METKKKHPNYNETLSLFKSLEAKGWPVVGVEDGDDLHKGLTVEGFADAVCAVDQAEVLFAHPNGYTREDVPGRSMWMRLVLGNSPGELVNDYSMFRGKDVEHDKELEEFFTAFYELWETATPSVETPGQIDAAIILIVAQGVLLRLDDCRRKCPGVGGDVDAMNLRAVIRDKVFSPGIIARTLAQATRTLNHLSITLGVDAVYEVKAMSLIVEQMGEKI